MKRASVLLVLVFGCGSRTGLLGVEVETRSVPDAAPSADAELDVATTPATCPADPPATTTACANVGAVCTYRRGEAGPCSDATAADQIVVRCERDGWLEVARCIDPSACPATMPVEGSPCTANGLDCFYASPTCASGAVFQCNTGVFHAVNDCGARAAERDCVPTPTLEGDARILVDAKGPFGERLSFGVAGTQVLAAWTNMAGGGGRRVESALFQTAVPSMGARLTGAPVGEGDSMPALDFAGDRFVVAWGAGKTAVDGLFTASRLLDAPTFTATPIAKSATERVDVAVGPLGGFLVDRRRLADGAFGTTATPITREGVARGPAIPLTDERAPIPSIPGATHAWSAIARWKGGFVIAASVGPAGDLWDDSGVLVYFVADPTAKELPRPVRVTIGQALEGDVVGLADGTVVLAAQLAGAPTRNPYALVSVRPDGTFERLTPPDLGVARSASPPRLAPFDGGFALAFSAARTTLPNGFVTLALRDSKGEASVDPIVEDATDLAVHDPVGLAYSSVDRALHLAWTRQNGVRRTLLRQRFVCRGRVAVE